MKNPFSPGRTVDPHSFTGREKEIKRFLSYLKSTKDGNPMNLAVLGERGIGKSSILRKYEYLAKEQKCITVRLDLDASFYSINTLISVILSEIQKEGQAYSQLFSSSDNIKSFFEKFKVSVELLISNLQTDNKTSSPNSLLTFRSELVKIWDNIKGSVPAIVIMIDEAEELEQLEGGALPVLRNIFTRLAEQGCGYMIVVSGKLTLFNKINKVHSPLVRFFNPIKLIELNHKDSMEALTKTLTDSPFEFSQEVKETIVKVSEGYPYIIQLFGYYLCENSTQPKIDKNIYDACFPLILDGLAEQLFRDYYFSLSQREQQILSLIAKEEGSIVSSTVIAEKDNKKPQEITPIFNRLYKKECLKKVGRGQYQLFHGLFKEYLQHLLVKEVL